MAANTAGGPVLPRRRRRSPGWSARRRAAGRRRTGWEAYGRPVGGAAGGRPRPASGGARMRHGGGMRAASVPHRPWPPRDRGRGRCAGRCGPPSRRTILTWL